MSNHCQSASELPAALACEAERAVIALWEACDPAQTALLDQLLAHDQRRLEFYRLLACSLYAVELVQRQPGWLLLYMRESAFHTARSFAFRVDMRLYHSGNSGLLVCPAPRHSYARRVIPPSCGMMCWRSHDRAGEYL